MKKNCLKLLKYLKKKVFLTTKLKNKVNYFLIVLLCTFSVSYAQKEIITFNGIVRNDSIVLQDINIVNKTSKVGTSSNTKGEFIMYASFGDSIQFTSISYKTKTIAISLNHIKNKQIIVFLEPDLNELDEIAIEQKVRLDFGKVSLPKGAVFEKDQLDLKSAPNARKLTDPTYGNSGLNFFAIIGMLTDKIFEKSRERKKEAKKMKSLQQNFPETILEKYGEIFFTENLNINKNDVYLFIDFCTDNGLKDYYLSDEFTIKNFMVIQSKKFLEIKKE